MLSDEDILQAVGCEAMNQEPEWRVAHAVARAAYRKGLEDARDHIAESQAGRAWDYCLWIDRKLAALDEEEKRPTRSAVEDSLTRVATDNGGPNWRLVVAAEMTRLFPEPEPCAEPEE